MTQSPATPLPPPKERRRLREAASLTQSQLAERMGVSRETVRAWETGRTTPRGRKREAYARLLATLDRAPAEPQTVGAVAAGAASGGPASGAEAAVTARQPEDHGGGSDSGRDGAVEATLGGAVEATLRQPALPAVKAAPRPLAAPAQATTATAAGAVTTAAAAPAGSGPETGSPLTPDQAFDALYSLCAPALVRQTYLLGGRRELAREAVERSFQLAWDRWPEVAVDPDPAGWVRAAAYEYALSPWHRFRPRYRHPEPPPADASDRALLDALLQLPPPYRRTLVLHDGVGLRLPETAAETEASTPAAAHRLLHARAEVAARLPELSDPVVLGRRLAELASTERLRAARPVVVRDGSERRARFWTRAAIAVTVAIVGATALTVRTAPTHYEPPVAPGETVRGLPPRSAPGPLSEAELELRAKLRREAANGPERLMPMSR